MSSPIVICTIIGILIVILGFWFKTRRSARSRWKNSPLQLPSPTASYGFVSMILILLLLGIGGYSVYKALEEAAESAPVQPRPVSNKSGLDSFKPDSRFFKKVINGQDVWEVVYYPDQQPSPGWIGPCGLHAGKYELSVLDDHVGSLRGRIDSGEHFSVRHGQIVSIPNNSCISFYSDRGSLIGIVIKRFGRSSGF